MNPNNMETYLCYPKIMVDINNPYNIILALHEVTQHSKDNIVILEHTVFTYGEMKCSHISNNFVDYDGMIRTSWIAMMRNHIGFFEKYSHFKMYNSPQERDYARGKDPTLKLKIWTNTDGFKNHTHI